MNTCKIDKQGRIVVPSSWREKHGVKPGADLYVTEGEDGGLSIVTFMQSVRRVQAMIKKNSRPGLGSAVDELLRERRREVALEERKAKRYERRRA